ncbi:MAG TPA: VOC family protein [Candidatus Limnocylindrales bacterium]|jgi:catechol 2,3-dioxygenase-like lactoylglutathione lyase family enzyme|nr:VOC family protein [Candidatus Limnocylindrales bacterium]
MQITDAPVHASLAAVDLARARAWYAEKLGWEPSREPDGTLVYEVFGSAFTVFETPNAGTAKNTVMSWNVPDVSTEVTRLRARGVQFEEYDFGEYKTVDGVMADPEGGKTAWFKDSEGNIISLTSSPQDTRPQSLSPMLAASDLDRAKAWYADKLGFTPMFELEGVVVGYPSGSTTFSVYKTEFAGTAKNTVAAWRLHGISDEVARLRGRGVGFEDYDFGDGDKTVDGILSDEKGPANAWFRDSEGNSLVLIEDRD